MSEYASPSSDVFASADGDLVHHLDTFDDVTKPDLEHSSYTLPRLRAKLLDALRREDFRTIQQHLPRYQQLLQSAVENESLSPDRVERMEAEHRRFHEQLSASLLTTRISLRLEIERVKASRQYVADTTSSEGIDLRG